MVNQGLGWAQPMYIQCHMNQEGVASFEVVMKN